ncbi:peptidase C12, ubiquitin carboxyl-terminal hydrolase 1 [Marasmius fiardii PR-910]|nr:peptidase C12, ubiquitin carboxyl-terminal hydrolase 1 [Marasmius fiardii PR-910]
MSDSSSSLGRWIPLECNPDWAHKVGLEKGIFQFNDVYGFDEELLAMVSKPVKAVLLLFPISEALEEKRKEEDEKIDGNEVSQNGIVWIQQTIANACGTIGLLHALINSKAPLEPGSPLDLFVQTCKDKSPVDRAHFLETTPLFANIHAEVAGTGQSAVPTDLDTELHFTCFVEDGSRIWELDGRRKGPVDRGLVSGDFLKDVANMIKETYVKDSSSIQFSMVALGPPAEEW